MNNKMRMALYVMLLVIGLSGGYWLAYEPQGDGMSTPDTTQSEKQPLFYRHPMNPAITSPVPAKGEMGMDYIPVYADGDGKSEVAGTVSIDPTTVQNIGVRTARVDQRTLSRNIRTVGRIDYDEEHLARLFPKTEGWIEKLYINKTGETVRKGSILLEIYSPQLVSSQEEYLLALQNSENLKDSPFEEIKQGAASLVVAARTRLELLDVPEHQIRDLEQTRKIKKTLHIHSPFRGVVTMIGAREGQHVTTQTELYRIADLRQVWVYVDVYEDDLPWVGVGDKAEMKLAAVPGRVFTGKVATVYPYLDAKTRTVKVRVEFANKDKTLKPDMYANVVLHTSRQVDALTVPSESVVRSGSRELVFVVKGAGKFVPREIKPGLSTDGHTQILEGLQAGEEVVVSAQFLIDSESKLREAVTKMLEAGDTADNNKNIPVDDKAKPDDAAAPHRH